MWLFEGVGLKPPTRGNFAHGTYLTGEKGLKRREFFELFLSRQGPAFFTELAESVCFDRDEEMDSDNVRLAAEDFISSDWIRLRGTFVREKGWFKLHTALRALLRDWTIIQQALTAMQDRDKPLNIGLAGQDALYIYIYTINKEHVFNTDAHGCVTVSIYLSIYLSIYIHYIRSAHYINHL